MYPLYWTPSKEGFIMRYNYQFKKKCVEMYQQGIWAKTPSGVKAKNFHALIRRWSRLVAEHGMEGLKHTGRKRAWTPEDKLEVINLVLHGTSTELLAARLRIDSGLLYSWIQKYRKEGYNGLVSKKKGHKPKDPSMKKVNIHNPRKIVETEYEELVRLRAENAMIKAENEIIKKEIALRAQREAARLKAKKQPSFKDFDKTVTH